MVKLGGIFMMPGRRMVLLSVVLIGNHTLAQDLAHADQLFVTNQTDVTLFCTAYYLKFFPKYTVERLHDPIPIPTKTTISFDRPTRKKGYWRLCCCAPTADYLTFRPGLFQLKNFSSVRIGDDHRQHIIITTRKSMLFHTQKLSLRRAQKKMALSPTSAIPHDHSVATVRVSEAISPNEEQAKKARDERIHAVLQTASRKTFPREALPSIGIACSGGGYRAMIATIGFLQGLEAIGMLDCAHYISLLSGSAWGYGAWLLHNMPLTDFKKKLAHTVARSFTRQRPPISHIRRSIMKKVSCKQPASLVDAWGAIISGAIARQTTIKAHQAKISAYRPQVLAGNLPIPIFTTIVEGTLPYQWFEITPFEAGSKDVGAFVDIEHFGRQHVRGMPCDRSSEISLEFILGLCGSAFGASIAEVSQRLQQYYPPSIFNKTLHAIATKTFLGDLRFSTGRVHNFMRGLCLSKYPKSRELRLIDAGIETNLPLRSLLQRNIDVCIICDARDMFNNKDNPALVRTATTAAKDGFLIPPITDASTILKRPFDIFEDPSSPATPTIIYILNQVPVSTFKFSYTASEFDALCNGMRDTVIQNREAIIAAIMRKVQQKSA